jgi:hypothetical protein
MDIPGFNTWMTSIEGRVTDLADELRRFKQQSIGVICLFYIA